MSIQENNEQDVGIELFVYQFRNQSTETDDREWQVILFH